MTQVTEADKLGRNSLDCDTCYDSGIKAGEKFVETHKKEFENANGETINDLQNKGANEGAKQYKSNEDQSDFKTGFKAGCLKKRKELNLISKKEPESKKPEKKESFFKRTLDRLKRESVITEEKGYDLEDGVRDALDTALEKTVKGLTVSSKGGIGDVFATYNGKEYHFKINTFPKKDNDMTVTSKDGSFKFTWTIKNNKNIKISGVSIS